MFDILLPPTLSEGWTFTSGFNDELFLLYATLVAWLAVVSAGLGSEIVLGPYLVNRVSSQ